MAGLDWACRLAKRRRQTPSRHPRSPRPAASAMPACTHLDPALAPRRGLVGPISGRRRSAAGWYDGDRLSRRERVRVGRLRGAGGGCRGLSRSGRWCEPRGSDFQQAGIGVPCRSRSVCAAWSLGRRPLAGDARELHRRRDLDLGSRGLLKREVAPGNAQCRLLRPLGGSSAPSGGHRREGEREQHHDAHGSSGENCMRMLTAYDCDDGVRNFCTPPGFRRRAAAQMG